MQNLKFTIHHPMKDRFDFQKADINLIRKAMNELNRERAFFNLDINEMVADASFKAVKQKSNPKTYWSKKISCIPLLLHENKFVTDFKEKLKFIILLLQDNVH